jgi:hypothetical protein
MSLNYELCLVGHWSVVLVAVLAALKGLPVPF